MLLFVRTMQICIGSNQLFTPTPRDMKLAGKLRMFRELGIEERQLLGDVAVPYSGENPPCRLPAQRCGLGSFSSTMSFLHK